MSYSQKYCIVHFISPTQVGDQFHINEWPLHVTLADVFAIDRSESDLDSKLAQLLANTATAKTRALEDTSLGTTSVVLLEKTPSLVSLHENTVTLLEANSAVFNAPEFNHQGFLPHCTIQTSGRLAENDVITIDSISLVDMFVGNDWCQRKVLASFSLRRA